MKQIVLVFGFLFSSLIIFAQFNPGPVIDGEVYGSTGLGGQLVTIDYSTGNATVIGNIENFFTGENYESIRALAVSPSGLLYGTNSGFSCNSSSSLIQIDPSTGKAIVIGGGNTIGYIVHALNFDANGALWSGGFCNGQMDVIDVNNGQVTSILQGPTFLTGIATDPTDGKTYVSSLFSGIFTVDLNLGTSNLIGDLLLNVINDLFFDKAGNLYGVGGANSPQLYSINKTTGKATAIGPHNVLSISGAAGTANFVGPPNTAVPTLGQWGLIILILILLTVKIVSIQNKSSVSERIHN